MVNNGIIYISQDAARILKHLHESGVERMLTDDTPPAVERMLKTLLTYGHALPSCALVVHNWRPGVMVAGDTGVGGQALAHRLGAVPVQMWLRLLARMDASIIPAARPSSPDQ